ncbi:MAG: hypothetical protein ACJZ8Y_18000 [Pirellulaceae bacterium]
MNKGRDVCVRLSWCHCSHWCVLHNGFLLGAEKIRLEDGDVVAFLGGTNMVRSVRAGALEYYLTDAFVNAETEVRFRDLSWEADTVYRLGTVKERWRP